MFKFQKYDFPNLGWIKIPQITIPQEDYDTFKLNKKATSVDYLDALVFDGFNSKIAKGIIPKDRVKEYKSRIDSELKVINDLLFTDYILLVYQLIRFCRENEILNSPARGSAGGSLILFLIEVIKIDPIKYDLLFERFISANRTEVKEIDGEKYLKSGSLPDIDIDVDAVSKFKINDWISFRFPNRSAAILTFSKLTSKIVIKETLKVVEDASEDDANIVSNMIEAKFGKLDKVAELLKTNEDFKKWAKDHEDAVNIAGKLNGLIKNSGKHASGIILTNDLLNDVVPTQLDTDGEIISSYNMSSVEKFGIKLDNLGLKNLNAIYNCLKMVGKKMEDIDLEDPSIYRFLKSSNDFYGIFQAEKGLGKTVLQKIQPDKFEDIMTSISVGRPGSVSSIDDILNGKLRGKLKKIDPRVSHILGASYNCLIYQENLMKLCVEMAGMSQEDANGVRKAAGKKDREKMLKYKDRFIDGSLKNKFSQDFTNEIWNTFDASGDYLFNRSHGCGYASLTAITSYIKANYPKEFFLCLLQSAKYEQDTIGEISTIQSELPHFGIELLPPHIIKSDLDFKIEGPNIRFGLGNIKGILEKNIEKLNNFRNQYSNKFQIFYGADEANLPINILGALISVGGLDDMLTDSRAKTLLEAQLWNILTEKEKVYALEYGERYGFNLINLIKVFNKDIKNDKGKPIIPDKRLGTIRKHYQPCIEIYQHNSRNEELLRYWMEVKLLGFSYSTSLYAIFKRKMPALVPISYLEGAVEDEHVRFVGEVIDFKKTKSKNKTPMLKIMIKDHTGYAIVFAFSTSFQDTIELIKSANNNKLPEEGDIVIVHGQRKNSNTVFAKMIGVQDVAILERISQLEDLKDKKEDGVESVKMFEPTEEEVIA